MSVTVGHVVSATATVDLGSGSFGSTSEFAANVTATGNTAPVLDNSRTPVLGSVNEDAGAPVGAVGTLISSLVDFASPTGQVDNVTDPDVGAQLGIAITAADTTNGTWWYSTDNGSNWQALGSVSNSVARLLNADANTRIYFQSNSNFNGTINSAITFRAWDRFVGSNGGTADTTGNGVGTSYSAALDVAAITVTTVNDAPTAVMDTAIAVEAGGTAKMAQLVQIRPETC